MTRIAAQDHPLDLDLMAYVDGTLPPHLLAQVEARLARDPEAREAVAQLRHADNVIRDLAGRAEALPTGLVIAALERELARRLRRRRLRAVLLGPRLRQIAASVALFAAGWGAHAVYSSADVWLAPAAPAFVASRPAIYPSEAMAASHRRADGPARAQPDYAVVAPAGTGGNAARSAAVR